LQDKIFLCEEPHLVIQGEGNLLGKKMLLFRVAGCDVRCVDCDTPYSWNPENSISYSFEKMRDKIYAIYIETHFDFIMLTGGAPSLYMDFINRLCANLSNFKFQIEDAGNRVWKGDIKHLDNVYFSFSPKIGALQCQTNIVDWGVFNCLPVNWICKIVVDRNQWETNLENIKYFQERYNIPNSKIYLMPKGTEREEIIEQSQFIMEQCFKYNYNFSPRLHILIYNNKRLV
jgi:7-carboxy-7-deazaguanine synthase